MIIDPRPSSSSMAASLTLETHSALGSPHTHPAYNHIPSLDLLCNPDNAPPFKSQERTVANAGIKDLERFETGHVAFQNPEKMGDVTKWVQEQIDKTFGGRVKRVSKF